MSTIYDFKSKRLNGKEEALSEYEGKVVVIVNTASKCGLTPQYEGLEKLQQEYGDKGLQILGYPCNQFGGQEPGTADEIGDFCQINYGVSFPMFEKIDVNGDDTDPLFTYLKEAAPGLMGSKSIKWNFTKFLVGKDGKVIERYSPKSEPKSMVKDIEALL